MEDYLTMTIDDFANMTVDDFATLSIENFTFETEAAQLFAPYSVAMEVTE